MASQQTAVIKLPLPYIIFDLGDGPPLDNLEASLKSGGALPQFKKTVRFTLTTDSADDLQRILLLWGATYTGPSSGRGEQVFDATVTAMTCEVGAPKGTKLLNGLARFPGAEDPRPYHARFGTADRKGWIQLPVL